MAPTAHVVVMSCVTLRAPVSGFNVRRALFRVLQSVLVCRISACPSSLIRAPAFCLLLTSSEVAFFTAAPEFPLRGSKRVFAAASAPLPLSSRSAGSLCLPASPPALVRVPDPREGPAPARPPWRSARQRPWFVLVLRLPWGLQSQEEPVVRHARAPGLQSRSGRAKPPGEAVSDGSPRPPVPPQPAAPGPCGRG